MSINTDYNQIASLLMQQGINVSSGRNPLLMSSSSDTLGTNMIDTMLKNAQNFISTAGLEATKLKTTLANLLGTGKPEDAVFNQTTTVSSDNSLMRIKSSNGKIPADIKVLIEQVATPQRNTGTALPVNGSVPANTLHRFEIEVEGKKHQLSFTTANGETNRSLQQKMAEAINKANIGVTAAIALDKDGKNSSLVIESKATGEKANGEPHFTIKDLTGNAVELTGAAEVSQIALDAVYSINSGERQSAKTNDIDLGSGVTVTLVKASEDEVTVTLGKNTKVMQNTARDLVNSYNKLLEAARGNQMDKFTRNLVNQIERAAKLSSNALNEIGITVQRNGFLAIDQEKMKAAAEDGSFERFFSGSDRPSSNSFTRRLERITSEINRNPNQFISPSLRRLPMSSASTNTAALEGLDLMSSLFDAFR